MRIPQVQIEPISIVPFRQHPDFYRTPLHDAARAGLHWTVLELLDRGADIKAVDKDGRTPLHDAARAGSDRTVLQLLDRGADIKAVDKDGRTALYDAIRSNIAGPVCLFIHLGANTHDLKHGLMTLRRSFGTLNPAIYDDSALLTLPDSIVQCFRLRWDGLITYDECDGDIADVLTISRTNPQGHHFVARTVSEYLAEMHPNFGPPLLGLMRRIFASSLYASSGSSPSARLYTQSSHLCVPRRSRPKFVDKFLSLSSSQQGMAVITGLLDAGNLTFVVSAESEASMSEVKLALAWILAVLRPRQGNHEGIFHVFLDQNSLERGLPSPIPLEPEKRDRYCWMQLFKYVVVVEVTHPVDLAINPAADGLEIELSLLMELAAVDRKATIEGGVQMMYGFDTAIIPLQPVEARRWHFMTTKGRQITPRRAETELAKSELNIAMLANQYLPGKVYIGWCRNPIVNICSKLPNTFPGEVIKPSGVPPVRKLEERSGRSTTKDFTFSPRLGFLGSSIGGSITGKREADYKMVVVVAKRTKENNFEGVLTSAIRTPSILWDSRSQRAWLLPVISVLAFAVLRYIEWRKYTFQQEQNGMLKNATVYYSTEMKDTGSEAQSLLRRNSSLMVDRADGVSISGQLKFEDIARDIWEKMCDGEDLCVDECSGRNREDDQAIFGYDLSEAMSQRSPQLRKLQYLPAMKKWRPLWQCERLQVIFSQYVGRALICHCEDTESLPAADGTLTCLLSDLRSFYGANWIAMTRKSCPRGLPIGEEFEWIPQGFEAGDELCSSQVLQSITKKQYTKLQKGSSKIHLPEDQCLICFG